MCDDALCPDTLFFYFEYDYRFYKRDDLTLKEWLPLCVSQAPGGVQEAFAVEGHATASSSTGQDLRQGPRTGAMRTDGGRGGQGVSSHKRLRRGQSEEARPSPSESSMWGLSMEGFERPQGHEMPDVGHSVAPELCDLVALCNAADSVGRGNMVWLGWNAGFAGEVKKKPTDKTFQFGSHCVAFTKKGAQALLEHMENSKATHIDLWLRDVVSTGNNQEKIGACIVHPAVGSYGAQHVSMNLKGARRASAWGHTWCQEGTREHPSALGPNGLPYVVRGIYGWTKNNNPPLLQEVPLLGQLHRWFWRTQLPPQKLSSEDAVWRRMLANRQWLWDTGQWRGPFGDKDHFACFPGMNVAEAADETPHDLWWKLKPENRWRQLQENPEGVVFDLNYWEGKLTRVASELVTTPRIFHDRGPPTERANRHHRQTLQLYRRRFFVPEDDDEVVWSVSLRTYSSHGNTHFYIFQP